MANFEQIAARLNAFLMKQGLPKITGTLTDLEGLFGAAMRSIWRVKDKQKRESLSFAVAADLRKLFGGKNLEDIYDRTKAKLDAEETAAQTSSAAQAIESKKKDPNYVPSFDELFGDK
ncbi:MAG: hypothetical protein JXD23_04610 [Spirochaetales bacterium]|nr:hypothetical protein [Spirochaetales bacterium]